MSTTDLTLLLEEHYALFPDYRDRFQVTFFVDESQLVQVCAVVSDSGTRERELRALLSAAQRFPRAQLTLVTLQPSLEPMPEPVQLRHAVAWFLDYP